MVFAELYWTPGIMFQCEDRAHRIGQTCNLPVHYLVAQDTMDEWVWAAVCKKVINVVFVFIYFCTHNSRADKWLAGYFFAGLIEVFGG